MYLTCPSVQSVRWATWADPTYTSPLHDDFYTSPLMRGWYKSWASTLISRVNTITGVAYRNEPAIFAWELANEPRCQGMGYASSNNCSLGFGATGVTPTVGLTPWKCAHADALVSFALALPVFQHRRGRSPHGPPR